MSQYSYQAFGSPMLGSTITTAPRRQGDGMDSESLLLQSQDSEHHLMTKLPPRHTNLNSTNGCVDVDRAKKGTSIPREPVKGAVKPLGQSGVTPTTSNTDYNTVRYKSHDTKPSLTQDKLSFSNSIKHEGKNSKPVRPTSDDLRADAELESTLMSLADVTSFKERTVEGDPHYNSETEKLVKDVTDLKKQLETQSKVNKDLKKLLVASMGDDLHHKVDSLIMTRAQLASEIGCYTDKIHEDYETLDKLSIQADMWRSKYTASRVLVDQLAAAKEKYEDLHTNSKRALQQFLQERTQLNESLKQTFRYLKLIKDSFDPRGANRPPQTIPNILELARTNHLLADSIKFRLLPAMPVFPSALDAGILDGPTPAEKLGLQVLSKEEQLDNNGTSGAPTPGRLAANLITKYDRFHPQVRYDNITFNCCAKCKGEIKVV